MLTGKCAGVGLMPTPQKPMITNSKITKSLIGGI